MANHILHVLRPMSTKLYGSKGVWVTATTGSAAIAINALNPVHQSLRLFNSLWLCNAIPLIAMAANPVVAVSPALLDP